MHTSFSTGFQVIFTIVCHQKPTHPTITRRRMRPLSHRVTAIHHPRRFLVPSTARGPAFLWLLQRCCFLDILLCILACFFYSVMCLCCLLLNLICLGFRLFVCEVIFFFFSFWFLFGNIFSTVTVHLNLHGFFGSFIRCLIRVFVLSMVISIRLQCGKYFLEFHSQMSFVFTYFEKFIVCLDLVYLSKLLASYVYLVFFLMLYWNTSLLPKKKKKNYDQFNLLLYLKYMFAHLGMLMSYII